ncbi:hypothetical protein ACHAW5_007167 [Stephanodiscus triporus]|uniref:Uncharacterized protein n=1 Tax=Stephanodiscus triporus TaxID=2934178 RepID=A0ABD3NYG7_9STRA
MHPEKIASIPEDMGKGNNDCGPHSPDGVDVELPTTTTAAGDDDDDDDGDDGEFESDESGSDRDDEEFREEREEEGGDEKHAESMEDMDAADLLALSKSRLGRGAGDDPQTPPATTAGSGATEEDDGDDDDAGADDNVEEEKIDADADSRVDEPKDQAYYVELAIAKRKLEEARLKAENDNDPEYLLKLAEKKLEEVRLKAENDNDPEYLLKLAEKKVQEAEAKARADEEAMTEGVIKPSLPPKPARSENTELWALLNYSKMRLETGTTPQVGKRRDSKSGSVRGDDAASVSSKLSKSSKLSMGSRNNDATVTVVGGPGGANAVGGEEVGDTDAPLQDVNDNGDASVDGSVSSESATKNDEGSDNSDDDDNNDDESSEDDEEEEELPEFLRDNDEGEVDPEEAKALYEAAKFKAASILSVTKDDLSDMQMLQAIAIAEEAAKKGEEKFSTKRSLFKLNEAKVEDLKAFLNLSSSPSSEEGETKKDEVGGG